jgi:hypothetical protein
MTRLKKQGGLENELKKKEKRKGKNINRPFIFRSFVNSFHYLYQDAEYLNKIAHDNSIQGRFERVQLSRTALLLYIFSLEALINRAMDYLLTDKLRDFFLEREDRFSLMDKWLLLPLLTTKHDVYQFDTSKYPWSHFVELVKLRNDFVHPKHSRVAYYKAYPDNKFDPLQYNEIPKDLNIKETNIIYRNLRIPKDPYSILPEHLDKAKKVVDDIVVELDKLLGGKIFKENWHKRDSMELVYPPGAKIKDLNWNLSMTK